MIKGTESDPTVWQLRGWSRLIGLTVLGPEAVNHPFEPIVGEALKRVLLSLILGLCSARLHSALGDQESDQCQVIRWKIFVDVVDAWEAPLTDAGKADFPREALASEVDSSTKSSAYSCADTVDWWP